MRESIEGKQWKKQIFTGAHELVKTCRGRGWSFLDGVAVEEWVESVEPVQVVEAAEMMMLAAYFYCRGAYPVFLGPEVLLQRNGRVY